MKIAHKAHLNEHRTRQMDILVTLEREKHVEISSELAHDAVDGSIWDHEFIYHWKCVRAASLRTA